MFRSAVLSGCPHTVAVARNLPDIGAKVVGNYTVFQCCKDTEQYVACQIFGFMAVTGLFKAEVEQLFHVVVYQLFRQRGHIIHRSDLLSSV